MSDYSIGGSGEKLPKARLIPVGTKVHIAEVGVVASRFEQTIQRGSRAGQKIQRHQLRVVYAALESGTDTDGKPYTAGQRFAQYLGGVYPKEPGPGYTITQGGSANTFIVTMKNLGVAPPPKLADFAGYVVTIQHVPTRNPNGGLSAQAFPASVLGKDAAAAATPPAAAVVAAPAAVPATTAAPGGAYAALSTDDQKALMDALAAGPVAAQDVVEAFNVDAGTAQAILDSAPKKANPLKKGA